MTDELGPVQYFEVQSKAGQIILTPVRIQRADALRAKLAELNIDAKTIESAVAWSGPASVERLSKAPAVKKRAVKPLSKAPGVGRRTAIPATADLKATLTRVFAKAAKQ